MNPSQSIAAKTPRTGRSSVRGSRWKRIIVAALAGSAILIALLCGWGYWQLRSSLPQLDGELPVAGLTAEVRIERDSLGIPTIAAANREDAAIALGMLHAQDRFFQMDLLRRISSGRLSGLLGAAPVEFDTAMRQHRFRTMVERAVASLPTDQRTILDAYSRGVNIGLTSLAASPPEYLLLRRTPEPWRVEDSLLVMLAMVQQLEPLSGEPKLAWTELREKVPAAVFEFLLRRGSAWDVPLDGSEFPHPPIPSAEVWSLREMKTSPQAARVGRRNTDSQLAADPRPVLDSRYHLGLPGGSRLDPELDPGSNAWAVSGSVTGNGAAILANDMHLGLRVPATWYRAVIECPMLDGRKRRLVGATLPGLPLVAVGSNGSLAWGVTSAHAVVGDLVELRPVDGEPTLYQTPDGPMELTTFIEEIDVAGGQPQMIEYQWSKWGPVVQSPHGRTFAYRCVIHDSRAIDLNLLQLETANTLEEAVEVANESGVPRLNCIIGDATGRVGWTLAGRLPKRRTPAQPTSMDWSTRDNDWSELLPADEYPRLLDPASDRVWSANDRPLGDAYLDLMGYGDLAFAARARQIRDRLFAQDVFDEASMLAIQLDHEAIYMRYWQQLLLEIAASHSQPLSATCIAAVEQWNGKASIDSVGYRVVSEFRQTVSNNLFGFQAVAAGRPAPPDSLADKLQLQAGWVALNYDDIAHDLLDARPLHWLPARFDSWEDLLSQAARTTEQRLTSAQSLEQATWGQSNSAAIQHPLSPAIPWIASWLDMPARQLPGDRYMPRVQGRNFGASQRLVVSPGREEEGTYHQPGGASGHFLSPFYRAGYDDWASGVASPLLPGKTIHRLTLVPR
jgi:penicillin G amidase